MNISSINHLNVDPVNRMNSEPFVIPINSPMYIPPVAEESPKPNWLQSMSPRVRESLEAWLKFGTVFVIYRMSMYYLVDRDSTDNELVDKMSVQLAVFILLGFTFYYMLVKPYIPVNIEHPILKNITNDTLMFGTVLVSSHALESFMSGDEFFDKEWGKNSVLILLAFACYRVFVNPFIPFDKMPKNISPMVSDWTQYGTFLLAFRLLRGKDINQKWILSVLFVLLGFTGYHIGTKYLMGF
jgi:hypothetical protein